MGDTLTNSLISYWKMDGNSNDSVGSLNGTDTNITYSAANGKIVQGAGFNGSSSGISCSGPVFATSGTFSFWYKATAFTPDNAIYVFDSTNGNRYIVYFNNSGTYMAWYLNSTAIEDPGSYVPVTGTWTHVVLTWDNSLGSDKEKVYINGTIDHALNVSITSATPANFYIGRRYTADSVLDGALDEIGVWNRALSSAEVSKLYNGGYGLQYPFPFLRGLSLLGVGN